MQSNKRVLVYDEEQVRNFVKDFLLLDKVGRPRIIHLQARNKYANGQLSANAICAERKIVDFDDRTDDESIADNFVRQLERLEILTRAGYFKDQKSGQVFEAEWMVLYITVFPLDEDDACDSFVSLVMDRRKQRRQEINGKDPASFLGKPTIRGLDSLMKTCLHKSPCSKDTRWMKLDVDTKDPVRIQKLQATIKADDLVISMETRGGFHVIVQKGKQTQELYSLANQESKGVPERERWLTIEGKSPMMAIPGTLQGGFRVRNCTNEWKATLERR